MTGQRPARAGMHGGETKLTRAAIRNELLLWRYSPSGCERRRPRLSSSSCARGMTRANRRLGKGALAPCPPFLFRTRDQLAGTALGAFAHPAELPHAAVSNSKPSSPR